MVVEFIQPDVVATDRVGAFLRSLKQQDPRSVPKALSNPRRASAPPLPQRQLSSNSSDQAKPQRIVSIDGKKNKKRILGITTPTRTINKTLTVFSQRALSLQHLNQVSQQDLDQVSQQGLDQVFQQGLDRVSQQEQDQVQGHPYPCPKRPPRRMSRTGIQLRSPYPTQLFGPL